MRRQLAPAVVVLALLTVLTGLAYPLAVTGAAQVAFADRANGSLLSRDGEVVGSRLIGQEFSGARYFHPRPSAAGAGYDAMASGPSNLGPTNPRLLESVRKRRAAYRRENGAVAPVDALTASASGLDPHISPANARRQAARVAAARGLGLPAVLSLVGEHTDGRSLGFLGEPGVNVLELNLALDARA
ncbi:MAG TPA: K(+)-transporting ATPase subunit C [Gaiellaceae bacterium]|nr:K(+)-transporting ATPase subunit C [Gaiellaceae bacterium]